MTKRDEDADVVLRKGRSDFLPNLRFFGLGWLVVLVVGQWLWFVAVIGIVAFGLLLLWSLIRTVIALALGAVLLFSGTSAANPGTESKVWAAKALLLAETFAYAVFVWLLYLSFFAAGRR